MLTEPRSILFQTELLGPEIPELRIDKDVAVKLYAKLRDPVGAGKRYENLDLQRKPNRLCTRRDHGESICDIGQHVVRLTEDQPETDIDGFLEIIREVGGNLAEFNLPPFIIQRCSIQCLVRPTEAPDALSLLAGNAANVIDAIGPFGRPASAFGMRFRFVPYSTSEDEGDAHDSFVAVRFESYHKDHKQIWMEVRASHLSDSPIEIGQTEVICDKVKETYDFLTEQCIVFLEQFDKREEPEPDEEDTEGEDTGAPDDG